MIEAFAPLRMTRRERRGHEIGYDAERGVFSVSDSYLLTMGADNAAEFLNLTGQYAPDRISER